MVKKKVVKKDLRQIGSSEIITDSLIKALPPGKRFAKKSGKRYYERRRNRSDRIPSTRL